MLGIDEDRAAIQLLLDEMGVKIGVKNNTKFARRLGPRPGDTDGERGDPRPLLVGFTHRHHTELITENSWKLSESGNPENRKVSVVRRQRAGEKEMLREVARKNLARAKREILAPIRVGEEVNEEGEVVWVTESEGGLAGGRVLARGGRQYGPAAATYPNCSSLGRKGGGGMM